MSEFWDSRFATNEYIYGKQPNAFLKQQLAKIHTGKILFAAEGEGRNAVYAAKLGFDVFAFDASEAGKTKALQLAKEVGVTIQYKISTYHDVVYPENEFDVMVLIFAHMPSDNRTAWHQKLLRYLKPGGKVILEGFSKQQLNYNSGGPRNLTMLFSEEELRNDFSGLKDLQINTQIQTLNEGSYHNGKASLIRLTGVK